MAKQDSYQIYAKPTFENKQKASIITRIISTNIYKRLKVLVTILTIISILLSGIFFYISNFKLEKSDFYILGIDSLIKCINFILFIYLFRQFGIESTRVGCDNNKII